MCSGEFGERRLAHFWQIIERAAGSSERLERLLEALDEREIYDFQDIFLDLAVELQDVPYSTLIADDQSEDGLEDISHWVVSQGRLVYDSVVKDPSRIPARRPDADGDLFGVAYRVYRKKTGRTLQLM